MSEHDLSKTIISYLDRHLAFPLLTHLAETGLYSTDQIFAAQYELAKGTNMFDYAANLFAQIYPDKQVPEGGHLLSIHYLLILADFQIEKEKAMSTLAQLKDEAQAVLDVIENPDVAQALRQDKNQNLQYLKDNYNVRLDFYIKSALNSS